MNLSLRLTLIGWYIVLMVFAVWAITTAVAGPGHSSFGIGMIIPVSALYGWRWTR